MVNRIKQIMGHVKLSPSAFADAIGIGRSSLTHIFTGRNQPSLDIVKKILKSFPEINPEWLIMGVGDMLRDTGEVLAQPKTVAIDNPTKALTNNQTDLFKDMVEEQVSPNTPLHPVMSGGKLPKSSVYKSKLPVNPIPREKLVPKTSPESNISSPASMLGQISNSHDDTKISQIIFFFEDHSFEIYNPSKKPT